MENNNRGSENNNPESTQGRESNYNGRQPLGFEGMNFEQKRGRYGSQSAENNRGNSNERTNNLENRQEQ
jgi:hypothetical protein